MSDPRTRRAEQVRTAVLARLAACGRDGGLETSTITLYLRNTFPGSLLKRAEVQHALRSLRKQGAVRYQGRRWELVP